MGNGKIISEPRGILVENVSRCLDLILDCAIFGIF
jgi:hypothetical protein